MNNAEVESGWILGIHDLTPGVLSMVDRRMSDADGTDAADTDEVDADADGTDDGDADGTDADSDGADGADSDGDR